MRGNFNAKAQIRKDAEQAKVEIDKGQRIKDKGQIIYITDVVNLDISATEIRRQIRENIQSWRELVSDEVAKYLEKYDIY